MAYNTADSLNAMTGTLLALAIITVCLRFYERKRQALPLKGDDWASLVGTICFTGASICTFWSIQIKELGYSSFEITKEEFAANWELAGKLGIAFNLFVLCTYACSKISVLFFYKRVFCGGTNKRTLKTIINVTLIVLVLWLVGFCMFAGFECGTHIAGIWDGTFEQYCKTLATQFVYGATVSDFLLNIWVLALPIPTIMQLKVNVTKRIYIVAIFLLAYIGLGASIARLVIFTGNFHAGDRNTDDLLLFKSTSFFLLMLEAGVSILAVNLPSLWSMLTIFGKENIAQRVANLFSLHSLSSRGSRRNNATNAANRPDLEAQSSQDASHLETHAKLDSISIESRQRQQST